MYRLYLREEGFVEPEDAGLYYVLARDGLYQVKRNTCFRATTRVEMMDDLLDGEESIEFLLPPLPFQQVKEAVAFFSEVFRRYRAEAVLLIYHCPDRGSYQLVAPRQEVSNTSCDYVFDAAPDGFRLVGSIHSHCLGSAHHSPTDDADDIEMEGLHITIGGIGGDMSYSCSVVADGRRVALPPEVVFSGFRRSVGERIGKRQPTLSAEGQQWLQRVQHRPPESFSELMIENTEWMVGLEMVG